MQEVFILGTERHESRELIISRGDLEDNADIQILIEDDLLRLFITDGRRALFEKIGMGDEPIEHRMLSRGIENAQRRIEARNFDVEKICEYDDVANDQGGNMYVKKPAIK